MHIRGNRRTKNTFVAVESRSLTEFYAYRVPAANPRFPPTTVPLVGGNPPLSCASAPPLGFPPPSAAETRIRERRWGAGGVALPPPLAATMVILPRIVKHAYPCGQVRKLQ